MSGTLPLADGFFSPEVLVFMIPIIAVCIPIVKALTRHHYELVRLRMEHQSMTTGRASDVQALRSEVRELKEQMHQQMIAMDSILTTQAKMLEGAKPQADLQSRVGQG